MSIADLKITEIHYNPAGATPPFIEITNTGTETVAGGDFFVGNSDYFPQYYDVIGPNATLAPNIPAGATIVLVPSVADTTGEIFVPPVPISQAEFEEAYGPLPDGAIYYNYPVFFPVTGDNPLAGGATYTIGGIDIFGDSVFIPADALEGQSVSVSLEDGSTSFGAPTPGSTDGVAPPPPPEGEEIIGTNSSDVLNGTAGDDIINAEKGNDVVTAGAGNDTVDGGKGKDEIFGGAGDDEIYGGGQNDTVTAGVGNDDVFGGTGNDVINGGGGEDEIYGGSGGDLITGGADNDSIFGDHGDDELRGGNGDDVIDGGVSNDLVIGGNGEDLLLGGAGNDILRGGADNDVLDGGSQADTLNGGDGDDDLIGGLGNDRMTGGEGADTFIFAGTVNTDVITDFEVGVDTIDVTTPGIAIQSITQDGNHILVDMGQNGSVTLLNLELGDLTVDDFTNPLDDIFVVG